MSCDLFDRRDVERREVDNVNMRRKWNANQMSFLKINAALQLVLLAWLTSH